MIKRWAILGALIGCSGEDVDDLLVASPDTGAEEEAFDSAGALAAMLSGRFDSSDQAGIDPTYYAVQLVACAVEAPELGDDVLYVEQALVDNAGAPYRQRLYVVTALAPDDEGALRARSSIYTLDDEDDAVGLCGDSEVRRFAAEDVALRDGCEVDLTWDGASFVGETGENTCSSSLNGASWATSEVTVEAERIVSWDRGWDDTGNQIWGATAGGYIFNRRE